MWFTFIRWKPSIVVLWDWLLFIMSLNYLSDAQTFSAKGTNRILKTLGGHTAVKSKIIPQFYKKKGRHCIKTQKNDYVIQILSFWERKTCILLNSVWWIMVRDSYLLRNGQLDACCWKMQNFFQMIVSKLIAKAELIGRTPDNPTARQWCVIFFSSYFKRSCWTLRATWQLVMGRSLCTTELSAVHDGLIQQLLACCA